MSKANTSNDGGAGAGAGGAGGEGGGAGAAGGAAGGAGAGGGAGVGQDGAAGGGSWLDGLNLPDDVRGHATIAKYGANPEGLARALISLEGRLGVPAEQLVRLPKQDDKDGWSEVWNKLGRPDKPDGYGDLKVDPKLGFDNAAVGGFLAHMHASGPFTPEMAQAALKWYGDYAGQSQGQVLEQIKADRQANEQALRGEWGQAYDANLSAAADAALKFGGKEFVDFVNESGFGDDPRFLKLMHKVAEASREPGAREGERGRDTQRGLTPAEAEAELVKLNSDEKAQKALQDPNHPDHAHYVQRRLDLFKAKRGG